MSEKKVKKLFEFCRTGNLFELKEIVEWGELDVNIRDKWDSTPLYYACLCGHDKIVEYLLQKGAKCDANTFDGERCFYSALTQNIKRLLKDYKAISKDCIRRSNYVEFFRRRFTENSNKDVCFVVHGRNIFAHRLILSVRSSYFASMFITKWKDRTTIKINNNKVSTHAFELMLSYIYTDRMDVPVEELENTKLLFRQCYLFSALEKLEKVEKDFQFYAATKPSLSTSNISILTFQPNVISMELNDSYASIVKVGLPYHFRVQQYPNCFPDFFYMDLPEIEQEKIGFTDLRHLRDSHIPLYSDICFTIDQYQFFGHKMFFCERSEYFKALANFTDVSTTQVTTFFKGVNIIELKDIQPDVFAIIYTFIYTDHAVIRDELLGEVLHFACLYMLPTLKTFCMRQMKGQLNVENVCEILKAARLYELPTLEQHCTEFMALYLRELSNDPEFIELLRSDVACIADRQEIDSVPLADDISFHLYKGLLPMSSTCLEVETKLEILDQLLEDIRAEFGVSA